MTSIRPIAWTAARGIRLLDQTRLPTEERYLELTSVMDVAEAIRMLRVRGAPLIGIAAAMGVVQALDERKIARSDALARVDEACRTLAATRPTAVNLRWALDRTQRRAHATPGDGAAIRASLIDEAQAIWDEDRAMCDRIGQLGLPLVPDGATVCTVCNAGALATGGIGTALAPIYAAHAAGRSVRVIVPETRPLLQGSRLTAWELSRAGVPCTVVTDNMVASRLRRGDVACAIVGADRIAANGDVANKIGTYALALAARAHGVPLYVAAPSSTVDLATPDGANIPIEERAADEVTCWGARPTAPSGVSVWNPAFDVTPAELVAGIITDRGLLAPGAIAEVAHTTPA
ncbi:MAG TPA: S-methyl-5-thioribose-1-phosphate isomerase [Gemmatimonadales bacterium]|nr:S-methyl-5-thioribose-1-phosphate isomerase [Gemmatimonadales bacterium]